jgi:hypothetical protein
MASSRGGPKQRRDYLYAVVVQLFVEASFPLSRQLRPPMRGFCSQ